MLGSDHLNRRAATPEKRKGRRIRAVLVGSSNETGGEPIQKVQQRGDSVYQIRRLIMNPAWPPLAVLGRLHSDSPAVPGWS